ncbi:MAG: hypothetical protein IID38_12860 [Planctomycetes bacterium]|nr:hypothetical protein [Planctomycetota bacterium]
MRLSDKLTALSRHDVDITVVAKSTLELFEIEADAFIESLVDTFHPTHIVEGSTFGFGRGRRGTAETLVSLASSFGCTVHIVDPITLQLGDGRTELVSSSLIRRLIAAGKVEDAQRCLGRPYVLTGQVVSGDGRGRQIGFPTANVAAAEQLIPADGVYAGRAAVRRTDVGGMTYRCAISIGNTPTFGGQRRRIEVHLLDFDESIYGLSIRVEFERFLRPQVTFESPDALVRQLHRDVEDVARQHSKG